MASIAKGIMAIFGIILFIIGLVDVAEQLKSNEEFSWPFPFIFIGFGLGIPFLLYAFPDASNSDCDSNEYDESYYDSDGGGDCGGE